MLICKKNEIRQIVLYGIIGATSASIDCLVYILLTNKIALSSTFSNFISVNIGIFISFILNTYINFKKVDKLNKRAMSFFSIGYIGLLISMLMIYIGVDIIGISNIVVKLVSVIVVAAIQFVLNKFITYK